MKRTSVRLSVCLSVPSIDSNSGVWRDRLRATAVSSKCGKCHDDCRDTRLNPDLFLYAFVKAINAISTDTKGAKYFQDHKLATSSFRVAR